MHEKTLTRVLREDILLREIWQQLSRCDCWVAGGWVRDRALGVTPPDLDLVMPGDTGSVGSAANRLASERGGRARLLGRPPKAVFRLEDAKLKIEIWPLGDLSPERDAARRDYTCNAMLWKLPNGPLLDPTGGLEDLGRRTVRAVSRSNLRRDPLRLLRGTRMVGSIAESKLERTTATWIRELAPKLAAVPRERVGAELRQLVATPRSARAFALAHRFGLLAHANPSKSFGGADAQSDLAPALRLLAPASHPIPAAARAAGAEGPLSWLAWEWGISSPSALSPFAWPQDSARNIATAARVCDAFIEVCRKPAADRREAIAEVGTAFPSALSLACAVATEQGDVTGPWQRWWNQWDRSSSAILKAKPPLAAHEIANVLGLKPGPELGAVIRSLSRAVVRREVRSAAGAIRWLQRTAARDTGQPGHS